MRKRRIFQQEKGKIFQLGKGKLRNGRRRTTTTRQKQMYKTARVKQDLCVYICNTVQYTAVYTGDFC